MNNWVEAGLIQSGLTTVPVLVWIGHRARIKLARSEATRGVMEDAFRAAMMSSNERRETAAISLTEDGDAMKGPEHWLKQDEIIDYEAWMAEEAKIRHTPYDVPDRWPLTPALPATSRIGRRRVA